MARVRAEGRHTGGDPPYGFKLEGDRLVEVESEQATLLEARELRSQGLTVRAIATTLAERGRRSRAGRLLTFAHIQRMLARRTSVVVNGAVEHDG